MVRQVGSRAGQTGTEYMLVISVIVIAVVGAAYVFVPSFEAGVNELGRDVSQVLALGDVGGIGHGGTNANAASPKSEPAFPGIGNAGTSDPRVTTNKGFANGGFSGLSENRGLGAPASVGAPIAPTSGVANGGSASPP